MKAIKLNSLRKELKNEVYNRLKDVIITVKDCKTVEELKEFSYIRQYYTPTYLKKDLNLKESKAYLLGRIEKVLNKRLDEEILNFNEVLNSGVLIEATIKVEWVKSRMWGANPKASVNYSLTNINGIIEYSNTQSSSIGGCGYDKLSTAVAEALNQILPIKRSLYKKKNLTPKLKNSEIFSYGSGYGVLPSFEGGIGVSCYPSIFKAIGYNFETVASGKMFDIFKITKI